MSLCISVLPELCTVLHMWSPCITQTGHDGEGGGGPDPPGKSQVAICFLGNTGMDPPREAIIQGAINGGLYDPL